MKKFPILLMLLGLLTMTQFGCSEQPTATSQTASAKATTLPAKLTSAQNQMNKPLLAIKFHADWCGSCKKIGPTFMDVQNKLDGQSVLFLELDFTNQTTKHQALLMADALGIRDIVDENNATGFVLLVDAGKQTVLEKLLKDKSVKEMAGAISAHL
ncbi:MAG: thioredoxin domain-containing protein [Bacteroidota bacterium]